MKTLILLMSGPLLALLALLAGCGDGFPDEEMHLGLEDKTRPYAITIEPPEAAPGETVAVTLHYRAPRPAAVEARWRVALDYATGPYGADEVERRLVELPAVPAPTADDHGFVTQSFHYTVPDSALLWSSQLPAVLTDPGLLLLAELLLGEQASQPPRKTEVAAWLAALEPADLAAMDPVTRTATRRLADLFACAIRFRVTLAAEMTVDVTRNLTVRHSGRLGSANLNANAAITRFAVGAVPAAEVAMDELAEWEDRIVWYEFDGRSPEGVPEARVPVAAGHTYFLRVRFAPQRYTSPFELEEWLEEDGEYRWYYERLDAPGSGHALFVNDEGDPAEMFELDDDVRLLPPGGVSRYRVLAVVRDLRGEWVQYAASPGATVAVGEVVFEAL